MNHLMDNKLITLYYLNVVTFILVSGTIQYNTTQSLVMIDSGIIISVIMIVKKVFPIIILHHVLL